MRQQQLRGFRLFTREEMLISDTAEASLRMDTIATLGQLAESTGGMLISHTNDVRAGIARAVGDLRGYYEIAYSPSNRAFDGKFRKITLKVSRPGVAVQTRSGYFAMPPGEGTATFPYEVRLLEAMRSAEPPRDLPIHARAFRFGREPAGQRYTLVLELPLDSIKLEGDRDPALERAHFSFMGVLRDLLGRGRREVQPGLAGLAPAQRARRSSCRATRSSCARSPLPEGRYRLETAALDQQSGRMTVEQSRLSVAPGPPAGGPQQPRGGEAYRAGAEGCSRLRRPVPGGRGPHRALGDGGGGGPGPADGPLLRGLLPAGRHGDPAGHARVPARQPGRGPCRADPAATRRRGPHPVRREPARRDASARAVTRSTPSSAAGRTAPGSARPSGSPGEAVVSRRRAAAPSP